jgi:hypothetical protein
MERLETMETYAVMESYAIALLEEGTITEWDWIPDSETGSLTLLKLGFADDTYVVASADYAGDGETVIGYTYSCYKNQHGVVDGPDEPLTTDGGTDLAEFPADMRLLASRPYNRLWNL